jgi:hypothetical protein
MGDVGDDHAGLRTAIQAQRDKSKEKALEQLPMAKSAAGEAGITIVVANDGHHWRFMREGHLLLNFWPASAKAQKLSGPVYRCRGWKHALSDASKILRLLDRGRQSWIP